MFFNTTPAAKEEKIVAHEYFVGIRVFDARRFGILLQRYRKSKAWSLPMAQRTDPTQSIMDLMFNVADTIPVTGSRKIISAVTLMESSTTRPLQNNEHVKWHMYVYGVRFGGQVELGIPTASSKFDKRVFASYAEMGIKIKPFNELTHRFVHAMEKQTCLR